MSARDRLFALAEKHGIKELGFFGSARKDLEQCKDIDLLADLSQTDYYSLVDFCVEAQNLFQKPVEIYDKTRLQPELEGVINAQYDGTFIDPDSNLYRAIGRIAVIIRNIDLIHGFISDYEDFTGNEKTQMAVFYCLGMISQNAGSIFHIKDFFDYPLHITYGAVNWYHLTQYQARLLHMPPEKAWEAIQAMHQEKAGLEKVAKEIQTVLAMPGFAKNA